MPDLFDPRAVTIAEQIACAERELGYRKRVYPRWVASARMSQEKADHETAAMAEIIRTLKELQFALAPAAELGGSKPLVLYLGSDADRDELIAVFKEVKPNAIARKL